MRRITSNIIECILTLLFCTTCTDILDQRANTDFNEEIIWQDLKLADAFLGNCYEMIGGHRDYILGMREDLLASCTDELLNIHRPSAMAFIKGTLSPDYLGHFGNQARFGFLNWSSSYSNIQSLNTFIANIDKVTAETKVDKSLKQRMSGEAYFIRAYEYTQLLLGYGGAILTGKPFKLGDDFKTLNRSSFKRTMNFIISDIDSAIANLPEKDEIEQGRATKGAAAALKSRLLLFCASDLVNGGYFPEDTLVSFTEGTQAERWQDARNAAKAVIDGQNVYQMRIKEFENGNMEWKLDPDAVLDRRYFVLKNYWLPIPSDEILKAPQLRNNPGY
jgi:hypothetical protein